MIKNIHLSVLGLSIACLLTVTGCDMFGSKDDTAGDKTKDKSGQTTTSKKAPVNINEVCTDAKIPANLEKSLKDKLVQQSTAFIVAQDSDIDLDKDKITAESDKIAVSISDVKAVEGAKASENGLVSCQANVSLELPEDMVKRANEVYKANNQNDDVLDANRIKDEAFTFMVNTNVKEDNLQVLGQSALLGVVSNTLANSSLKAQGATQKSQKSASQSSTAKTTTQKSNNSSVAPKQTVASSKSSTTAQQQARAKKRAQEKARAKKRAQQRALAKKRAQAKKKAQQQATAKKQVPAKAQQQAVTKKQTQEQAKPQQQAVAKKQTQEQAKPRPTVKKNSNENAVIQAQRAKEGIKDNKQLKQNLSVETKKQAVATQQAPAKATAPSKPLGVKNSDNIEVVIVEESGTY